MTNICVQAADIVNEKGKSGFLEFVRGDCTLSEIEALHDTLGVEFELEGGHISDAWGAFFSPNITPEQRMHIAKSCDEQLILAGW